MGQYGGGRGGKEYRSSIFVMIENTVPAEDLVGWVPGYLKKI